MDWARVMRLIQLHLNQGYQLFVDNIYTSVTLFKTLFTPGVPATGTIVEARRTFPAALKNHKDWAKGKERGTCIENMIPHV